MTLLLGGSPDLRQARNIESPAAGMFPVRFDFQPVFGLLFQIFAAQLLRFAQGVLDGLLHRTKSIAA